MDYPELTQKHEAVAYRYPHPSIMDDGVYFNLDEDVYHGLHRLSVSGIKALRVSNMHFWASSWMNPMKDEEDTDTDAKILGRAYGYRILEGQEKFDDMFVANLDKADYPDALVTAEHMKTKLTEMGVGFKSSTSKPELANLIYLHDPSAQIWDRIVADYAIENEGLVQISAKQISRIQIAAAMIEKHPDISQCFRDGYPEVTILHTDPATGVRLKHRIDYLKLRQMVDLKSFSNPMNKPVDRAIYSSMASYKYHIQAAAYMDAGAIARSFIRQGIFQGNPDPRWVRAFSKLSDPIDFIFVFQMTGSAPVTRAFRFPRKSMYQIGQMEMRQGIAKFDEMMKTFGPDVPWIDIFDIDDFDDQQFPVYATE